MHFFYLQESEDNAASLHGSLQRSELSASTLAREDCRHKDRILELEDRLR